MAANLIVDHNVHLDRTFVLHWSLELHVKRRRDTTKDRGKMATTNTSCKNHKTLTMMKAYGNHFGNILRLYPCFLVVRWLKWRKKVEFIYNSKHQMQLHIQCQFNGTPIVTKTTVGLKALTLFLMQTNKCRLNILIIINL